MNTVHEDNATTSLPLPSIPTSFDFMLICFSAKVSYDPARSARPQEMVVEMSNM